MEFGFLVIGLLLIMTGLNNTTAKFFSLLGQDMLGANGFLVWAGLLAVIALGGRVTGLEVPARILMTILIVVFIIKNPKSITDLGTQLGSAPAGAPADEKATGQPARATPAPQQ